LAGFYPEDPLQALVVDEVMDSCNEIMGSVPRDADEEEKKTKRKEWQEGAFTKFANFIESRIQAAGGTHVVKEPSIADLILKGLVDGFKSGYFDYIDTDFFDKYPGIM
jgi:prostaglandin-H2 D-isomerase / glutathione transferase